MPETRLWFIFAVVTTLMLVIDLGVFHRRVHAVKPREAAIWSAVWVAVSLLFCLVFYLLEGKDRALMFLTGYLIEKSLSVDNIFVFVLIFSYFGVPAAYQHRVLFWGVIGAIVFRAIFIFGGIVLLSVFHWVAYLLGALLVWGGLQMFLHPSVKVDPEKNRSLRIFRRLVPMVRDYDGPRFLVRREGRILATPLLAVLIVIETTDVVFALDSIPAILAISRDPFIVYSSNIFAILGLRALYFLFAAVVDRMRFLHLALGFILIVVGIKMGLSRWVEHFLTTGRSLLLVGITLVVAVIASLIFPKTPEEERSKAPEGTTRGG